jgi:hypothetical protein
MTETDPATAPGTTDRLAQAARLMLDELESHRAHEAELARAHGAARDRGAALMRAIDVMLRGLAPPERAPFVARLGRIEGPRRPPPPGRTQQTPAMAAVLAFLAAAGGDAGEPTVTVPALAAHLDRIGLRGHRRYAACTLARLARQGLVARVRHAVYTVNRYHPELMAVREADRPAPAAP